MKQTKPFNISKQRVVQAYQLVKINAGSAGVDNQSLEDFEKVLKNNLYKIWNRMSSGSYFPPAVKGVVIPKKAGGERLLGVPTVADRIAQMVVKLEIEPMLEPHFLQDSYGYRPRKSALDAVGITRKRCWQHNWVLEFDIKGLFDNIDHRLLMKAVRQHIQCKWALLHIERWLTAPMLLPDGNLIARTQGVPQGGVVSPLLSNVFLHYVFDAWMQRRHPHIPWCRYADDGLLHCDTEEHAQHLRVVLAQRFKACGLELHPVKTKIVYCKDSNRKGDYATTTFDFLGYTFRGRSSKNRKGQLFVSFSPAISKEALKSMRNLIRKSNLRNRADRSLDDLASSFNPVLQGWINYYGRYCPSALYPFFRYFNHALVSWAMRKYKRFRRRKTGAGKYLERIAERKPHLFAHWRLGMTGVFA